MRTMKREPVEDRIANARQMFDSGHNCAQAVLMSFSDLLERDEQELMRVAAGFGGGMGKLQLTCGAVTGSFMVFSLYASTVTSSNEEAKELSTAMIRQFEKMYVAENGSLTCRIILGVDMNTEEGMKEATEKNLFKTVCADAVASAVVIADTVIRKMAPEGNGHE